MQKIFKQWKIYTSSHLLAIMALGFSSGLPFLLTLSTLTYWLAEEGVSKTTIGTMMLVTLPYCLKPLWAPVLDHLPLPYFTKKFGQRRGWALASQLSLIVALIGLGMTNPGVSIVPTAILSVLVSLFAATQDIVIDAYRIEILKPEEIGAGAAMESIGFRTGMVVSGAGALYLSHIYGWTVSYMLMAVCVIVGFATVIALPEPSLPSLIVHERSQHKGFWSKYHVMFIRPIQHFPYRKEIILILAFIFFFKAADTILNAMSAPFLYEIGFDKVDYANISKVFGTGLMVIGGLAAGFLMTNFGIMNTMMFCIALQFVTSLMFAIQAMVGNDISVLMITVGAESFCSGMIAASFIAYLSTLAKPPYTATHFTLLYSFGSLARVIVSTASGWLADHISWLLLFVLTACISVPTIILMRKIRKSLEDNDIQPLVKTSEQKYGSTRI